MSLSTPKSIALVLALLLIAFLSGRSCAPEQDRLSAGSQDVSEEAPERDDVWTCAMHPQVRLPEPGRCPICFMDLTPLALDAADGHDDGPRTLVMSEAARALAEIETAPVERRLVAHEVRMVGKVAYDETRLATITARVPGRLDRLFVDYTGVRVREQDHLVEIYSPALYTAQQELLQVMKTTRRLDDESSEMLRRSSQERLRSAREKLRLLGMQPEQIDEILTSGTPSEHVTLLAPIGGVVVHKNAVEGMYVEEGTRIYTIADLSKVWVLLDAYESDIAWLRYGQDVELRISAYAGETFHGRIAFIDPVLDDRTRTVKVRLIVDNADGRLKPDMLVSGIAAAKLTPHGRVVDPAIAERWMCPMHPEILADELEACSECGMDLVPATELGFVAGAQDDQDPLVIPATAPLLTGERAVVYVRLPGRERPTFQGRVIELGPRAGDAYVVHSGLSEGEQVVVRGNFKIDSELQIRAAPSMMNPVDEDAAGATPPGEGSTAQRLATPPAFRRELGAFVDGYLALHDTLASDDEQASRAAAAHLLDAFAAIDTSTLDPAQGAAWKLASRPLWRAVRDVAASEELAARRVRLAPLTDATVELLQEFGFEHEAVLGVFHCPMALDNAGASWLQGGETVENPYYGASMLRCGTRVDVLDPGDGGR